MDPYVGSRSRLMASSDPDNLRSISLLSNDEKPVQHRQLSNILSENQFLNRDYHEEDNYNEEGCEDKSPAPTWRLKERMKTSGVALVVCLNIGIDPPDIIKPNPCARKECWFDPTGSKQKGLDYIGHALQQQYEKWQAKAKYKQCLDPTSDELRKVCITLRKNSRSDRLLLHYNGHGVPKPTKNGELWVFGKYYTHYTPVAISELAGWLGDPAIYVLDCSGAGVLLSHLVRVNNAAASGGGSGGTSAGGGGNTPSNGGRGMQFSPAPTSLGAGGLGSNSNGDLSSLNNKQYSMEGNTIVLAACKANEILPLNPLYPADLFTSCLTTPIQIAIRWFILQVGEASFWFVFSFFSLT
jgi:regulatory associated protein of mTOR